MEHTERRADQRAKTESFVSASSSLHTGEDSHYGVSKSAFLISRVSLSPWLIHSGVVTYILLDIIKQKYHLLKLNVISRAIHPGYIYIYTGCMGVYPARLPLQTMLRGLSTKYRTFLYPRSVS